MISKDKSLKLNLVMGVIYPVVMLIVNFLSKQAIQRVLGTEYQGVQTVFGNFCDMFAFAFMGVGIAMTYHLYKAVANEDKEKVTAIYQYFSKVFKIIAIIMLAVGLVATALVMWSINADIDNSILLPAYYIYLVGVVFSGLSNIYFYFLTAYHKQYVSRIIFCLTELAALIIELIILYSLGDYILFLVVVLVKSAASVLIYMLYTKKKFGFVFSKTESVSAGQKKKIKSDIKDMIITRAGTTLVTCTDTILASGLVSTFIAGCYSNYYFVFYGLSVFGNAIFDSFMDKIGHMLVLCDKKENFNYFVKLSVLNIVVSVVFTCGCYILSDSFITLWIGDGVLLPHYISAVVSLNMFMFCMRLTTLEYRQAAGLFDKASQFILARGIANVVLSIILGMWIGLLGILLATAITYAATIYWYEPYLVLKYFGKKMRYELLYQFVGVVVTISAIWITELVLNGLVVDTWITFILKGIFVVLVSVGWCALLLGATIGIKKIFFKGKNIDN